MAIHPCRVAGPPGRAFARTSKDPVGRCRRLPYDDPANARRRQSILAHYATADLSDPRVSGFRVSARSHDGGEISSDLVRVAGDGVAGFEVGESDDRDVRLRQVARFGVEAGDAAGVAPRVLRSKLDVGEAEAVIGWRDPTVGLVAAKVGFDPGGHRAARCGGDEVAGQNAVQGAGEVAGAGGHRPGCPRRSGFLAARDERVALERLVREVAVDVFVARGDRTGRSLGALEN